MDKEVWAAEAYHGSTQNIHAPTEKTKRLVGNMRQFIGKKKQLGLFMLVIWATMMTLVTGAWAKDVVISKVTGTTIGPPTYDAGDTLVIKGDALTTTDRNILKNLTKNYKLDMRNNQTTIPDSSLENFLKITDLDLSGLGNKLTLIGANAFKNCDALVTVDLTGLSALANIKTDAFSNCQQLTSVTIDRTIPPTLDNDPFFQPNIAFKIYVPNDIQNSYDTSWSAKTDLSKITGVTAVAKPTATLPSGSYPQPVTLSCTTSGATIYYTTDGSEPKTSPTKMTYSAPLSVTSGTMLKAYAKMISLTPSDTLTITYGDEQTTVKAPVATPKGGTYTVAQAITLKTDTVSADIHYTLDGTDPTTSATKKTYVAPFVVSLDTTLKAYASKTGMTNSAVIEEKYTKGSTPSGTVATPQASPATGLYAEDLSVTLTSEQGATIHYRVYETGSTKKPDFTQYSSGAMVVIDTKGKTLESYATKAGMYNSSILTQTYSLDTTKVFKPAASPSGKGSFSTPPLVTLTSKTTGATIYYTLDGSDPINSATRKLYSAPIIVPLGTTLKAYAIKVGLSDSVVLTQTYYQSSGGDSGSGGCNAGLGFAGLALLGTLFTARTHKKRHDI